MPRPSKHNPITKSYAIDQIEDIEHLRAVAHRMWEAFTACHAQFAHVLSAVYRGECRDCQALFDGEIDEPECKEYKDWQRKVSDGFGSV